MEIAKVVAQRSTCLRRQVGAIIVKERRVLTTGYNGAPANLAHCLDVGCERERRGVPSGERHELCRGLHAEQNAIIQAAVHGVSIQGGTLYTTDHPCSLCAKMLVNAGIRRVVYSGPYPDELAVKILAEAGISVERLGGEANERKGDPAS
jgi:dCMP deaminase